MYETLTIRIAAPAPRKPLLSLRRIGGLYHWRIGSVGGSVYRSRQRTGTASRIAATVATLAIAACAVPADRAPQYAAIVTLASGNEYQIETGTLSTCRATIADMSASEARCERVA